MTSSFTTSTTTTVIDNTFFIYQNPRTGNVVTTTHPLSIRQLVPLVMPNNNSPSAILPPTTQCLEVVVSEDGSSFTYSETWKSVSQIDILKEAACKEWYWSCSESGGDNKETTTNGPGTCRDLWKAWNACNRNSNRMMVFAPQSISSSKQQQWTPITVNLQHVFEILQDKEEQEKTIIVGNANANNNNNTVAAAQQNNVTNIDNNNDDDTVVQDELEAFLNGVSSKDNNNHLETTTTTSYESDGGTTYIQDPRTGNFIHEALVAPEELREALKQQTDDDAKKPSNNNNTNPTTNNNKKKKKSKKASSSSFKKSNAKHWIYVSGLPTQDITEQDIAKYFGKAGLIELDPVSLQPKIKLYRREYNKTKQLLKGDCSVCYANTTSVDLALQVLDESWWDETHQLHVERAHFEAKEDNIKKKRSTTTISQAQRKVARLALKQAQDDGDNAGRLAGGRKGLRIIVVKYLLGALPENILLQEQLDAIFSKYGEIEKMTAISETNVVIVKYVEPVAASKAVEALHGSLQHYNNNNMTKKLEAIYWDGVTDYTTTTDPDDYDKQQRQEEEARHEDFGKWLEETSQDELPPELRLQVAGDGGDNDNMN